MNISEKQLREIIVRAILRIEEEQALLEERRKQKIYMMCSGEWDERYLTFIHSFRETDPVSIVPVIPEERRQLEARFTGERLCPGCLIPERGMPKDLETAVTVFPVVPRDVVVKAALCISDTHETRWITSCMEAGGRIVFLTDGLARFSGKEPGAYVERVLSYYRTVLEYGIEIRNRISLPELLDKNCKSDAAQLVKGAATEMSAEAAGKMTALAGTVETTRATLTGKPAKARDSGKKAVISSKDVELLQRGGVLIVNPGDIITDLARDRAKFLNVTFKTAEEV